MSNVKIDIYNVLGQKVKTLVDNTMMAGNHYVQWNGKSDANKNLPSGVYLVKFSAGEFNYNQKNNAHQITCIELTQIIEREQESRYEEIKLF